MAKGHQPPNSFNSKVLITMTSLDILFTPAELGDIKVKNRLAMAPCSRHRAHIDGTPTDMMVEYYYQRASAGLLISEATSVSPMAVGYVFTPGIWTKEHVAGWRKVTDAVHEKGGAIVCQLTHAGRMSDPLILPHGEVPVSASAVQPDPTARHYTVTCPRPKRHYPEPRALTTQEVRDTVADFARAASLARDAGFDGVEIHGASGYLTMQFLSTNTNLREDEYGGGIEGRAKFMLDCVKAMQDATSQGFVAAKIGPGWTFHDVFDTDPQAHYAYVAKQLSELKIAYLQVGNFGQTWDVYGTMRPQFDGPMMGVKGFSRTESAESIASGLFQMIAYGQAYIANPDLKERFENGWSLNVPDPATFYTQGIEGFTDYPAYQAGDPEKMVPVETVFGAGASGAARPAAMD